MHLVLLLKILYAYQLILHQEASYNINIAPFMKYKSLVCAQCMLKYAAMVVWETD